MWKPRRDDPSQEPSFRQKEENPLGQDSFDHALGPDSFMVDEELRKIDENKRKANIVLAAIFCGIIAMFAAPLVLYWALDDSAQTESAPVLFPSVGSYPTMNGPRPLRSGPNDAMFSNPRMDMVSLFADLCLRSFFDSAVLGFKLTRIGARAAEPVGHDGETRRFVVDDYEIDVLADSVTYRVCGISRYSETPISMASLADRIGEAALCHVPVDEREETITSSSETNGVDNEPMSGHAECLFGHIHIPLMFDAKPLGHGVRMRIAMEAEPPPEVLQALLLRRITLEHRNK